MKRTKKKASAKSKQKSKVKPKRAPAKAARKPAPKPAAKPKSTVKPGAKPQAPLRPKTDLTGKSPSELIDLRILDVAGWRAETLSRMRTLIREAHPAVVEEWKWEVPVWSHDGIVCTGEVYQNVVKLTFAHGAAVPDPSNLFNSSLQGNTRRAIDIHESDKINEKALKALIRAAVELNTSKKKPA